MCKEKNGYTSLLEERGNMEEIRLQKFMADIGIASRRKCEQYISEGKVKVNGTIITELGTKINPNNDVVEFENKKIELKNDKKEYILLNKPIGYVTTVKDQFDRPTVLDLVKEKNIRLVPVGRLDMYTSGALILTNDGDFVYKITHPKHEIEKSYIATIKGSIEKTEISELEKGVQIEDYITKPAKVKILKIDEVKKISRIEITIHEGKNREVRKMCESIGHAVISLHRNKIGSISVKDLKIGTYRNLKKDEIEKLINNV